MKTVWRLITCFALWSLGLALLPGLGEAQTGDEDGRGETARAVVDPQTAPRPTTRAVRASGPIEIDGYLNEPSWDDAQVVDRFVQAQPDVGHPASERTEVRILYDDDHLYVGAILYDAEPHRLAVAGLERSPSTRDNDLFAVSLDTYLDRRNSFLFGVNPGGAVLEGQAFDDGRNENLQWEGVVHVATRITDEGWIVEMAIPWTTLRFTPDSGKQTWGLNFLRRILRKNEDAYWAPLLRHERLHKMSRAGYLEELEGLRATRNLTAKPFVLAGTHSGAGQPADGSRRELDGGVDLKYAMTSALTLDLTYRTDFSQVEADQERVNLTRFSLFFPERRQFFLENASIFAFGDISERNLRTSTSPRDFTLFHSRRIGLTDEGRSVPIQGGARVSGRAGGFEVGLLGMRTGVTSSGPSEDFAVARVRRGVFSRSDVGFMVTSRGERGPNGTGGYNRAYGADLNLRFLGSLVVHSYLVATDTHDGDGNGNAARLTVGWRDDFWNASAMTRLISGGFEPGLGFVRRREIRHHYGTLGIHHRSAINAIFEVNPWLEADFVTDPSGLLESRDAAAGIGIVFRDGGTLSLGARDRFERLSESFPIFGEIRVSEGEHRFREATASYRSNPSRLLSGRAEALAGEFFDGTRRGVQLQGTWRPGFRFSVDLTVDHNDVTLPEGRFQADVAGVRVRYSHSTTLFGSALLQYNAATDHVVSNLRLQFIHSPLSDVFLLWTERRDVRENQVLDRGIVLKVTKLFAF